MLIGIKVCLGAEGFCLETISLCNSALAVLDQADLELTETYLPSAGMG